MFDKAYKKKFVAQTGSENEGEGKAGLEVFLRWTMTKSYETESAVRGIYSVWNT